MDQETNDIIELLDILYGMVTEAWGVPMGNNKCIIERDKATEIISEIKSSLPASIAEANRLVAARDEFIGNAKREAEAMRKSAEDKARALIEEQEIVRNARALSEEIIADAENKSKTLRRVASDYVNEIMNGASAQLSQALKVVEQSHEAFNKQIQPAAKPAASANPSASRTSVISRDED